MKLLMEMVYTRPDQRLYVRDRDISIHQQGIPTEEDLKLTREGISKRKQHRFYSPENPREDLFPDGISPDDDEDDTY